MTIEKEKLLKTNSELIKVKDLHSQLSQSE
jgi:hypothetical protein